MRGVENRNAMRNRQKLLAWLRIPVETDHPVQCKPITSPHNGTPASLRSDWVIGKGGNR